MYEDKILICRDCGREFVFTAGEQAFYAEKGFMNEPTRCKECRDKRKAAQGGSGRNNGERRMYQAVCADCGRICEVPFEPRGDKPVYCSECFQRRRAEQNLAV